jgi:hypothetical protein
LAWLLLFTDLWVRDGHSNGTGGAMGCELSNVNMSNTNNITIIAEMMHIILSIVFASRDKVRRFMRSRTADTTPATKLMINVAVG